MIGSPAARYPPAPSHTGDRRALYSPRDRERRNGAAVGMAYAVATGRTAGVEAGCPGAGGSPSFDDVLTRHQAEIYRFAVHLTRDPTDADDLYQETLLKAYRAFDRLDGAANHRAWLYKIASNAFLSDRRKRAREAPLDGAHAEAIPAAPRDHAARLDAKDLLVEVERFVAALPPKQRIALVARRYHDLPYDEIAATLRCSEAAARASVHEALRKLRDRFGDRL